MSGRLAGRVVIVTGAGRGLGAAYARRAAAEGASVVINDLDQGADDPAQAVVDEIVADGQALVRQAVDAFGRLDVLINNAGILRHRPSVDMSEAEWDDVVRVHLRGHFCTIRNAAAYWRDQHAAGERSDRVIINTTSIAGLHASPGHSSYSTAKSGVATLSLVCHQELHEPYGIRTYAVAPGARTRLTQATPEAADAVAVPDSGFDYFDPDNVAPFVAWLAAENCPMPSGTIIGVEGDVLRRYNSWSVATEIRNDRSRWSLADIDARYPELAEGFEHTYRSAIEVALAGLNGEALI